MRRDQTAGRQHGNAEREAMADDVVRAKHHLQFPTVGKIQQIFVCHTLVLVSILSKVKVLRYDHKGKHFNQTAHV